MRSTAITTACSIVMAEANIHDPRCPSQHRARPPREEDPARSQQRSRSMPTPPHTTGPASSDPIADQAMCLPGRHQGRVHAGRLRRARRGSWASPRASGLDGACRAEHRPTGGPPVGRRPAAHPAGRARRRALAWTRRPASSSRRPDGADQQRDEQHRPGVEVRLPRRTQHDHEQHHLDDPGAQDRQAPSMLRAHPRSGQGHDDGDRRRTRPQGPCRSPAPGTGHAGHQVADQRAAGRDSARSHRRVRSATTRRTRRIVGSRPGQGRSGRSPRRPAAPSVWSIMVISVVGRRGPGA